jgi:hypothetical protein
MVILGMTSVGYLNDEMNCSWVFFMTGSKHSYPILPRTKMRTEHLDKKISLNTPYISVGHRTGVFCLYFWQRQTCITIFIHELVYGIFNDIYSSQNWMFGSHFWQMQYWQEERTPSSGKKRYCTISLNIS